MHGVRVVIGADFVLTERPEEIIIAGIVENVRVSIAPRLGQPHIAARGFSLLSTRHS
jgi:hypothetical protein